MRLYNELQNDYTVARKQSDTLACKVLSTLLGELQQGAVMKNGVKIVEDKEVIRTIKSWVKRYDMNIESPDTHEAFRKLCEEEKDLIEGYLPEQMSEDDLRRQIGFMVNDLGMKLPEVMKSLKEDFEGQYDGKQASTIVREMVG